MVTSAVHVFCVVMGFTTIIYSIFRRDKISTFLTEERAKKFGADIDKDFSGPSDAADSHSPFYEGEIPEQTLAVSP